MAAPRYCTTCGREIKIHIHPLRNPRSGKTTQFVKLKGHDLCRQCVRSAMSAEMAKQRNR